MLNTIGWFFDRALAVLGVFLGIFIFCYILKNGTGAIKDLVRTIGLAIKAACLFVREKLIKKLDEEPEETEVKKTKTTAYPTYEEYCEMVKNKETFTL